MYLVVQSKSDHLARAETIDLEFHWIFRGHYWTLTLSIPQSLVQYYQSLTRIPTEDYSVYVTHPYDDEYINTIIQKFNFIAIEYSYTEIEKIDLIISFVQNLPCARASSMGSPVSCVT
jgi:hypothetical protein